MTFPRILIVLLYFFMVKGKIHAQSEMANDIKWTVATKLPDAPGHKQPGVAGAFVGIHKGVMLIAGGANFPDQMPWQGGTKNYKKEIYILRKAEAGYACTLFQNTLLPHPVAYGGSTSMEDGVVCVGGEINGIPTADAFLMRWEETRVRIISLPSLPIPLTNVGLTHIGSVVYAIGGENEDGPSRRCFSLNRDDASPSWTALPDLPSARSHAVVVAQSDGSQPSLYVLGGRSAQLSAISKLYGNTFRYNPVAKTWSEKAPIGNGNTTTNLSAGTGVAVGASYILLIGGDQGQVFHRIEDYNIRLKQATDLLEADRLKTEKLALLTSHTGFSKELLLYNTITDTWTSIGTLPQPGPVTTTAVKWGDDILIPSGEIRPGLRTPEIIVGSIQNKTFFSWIDSLVLLICFLLMTAGRYLFTGHTNSTHDYFKGGERIPQWAAGISIFGAKLSAITFMGIPAKTYATDWTYFFLLMTIILVMPIVARYFIPFYRRLGVTSAYEYLGQRFHFGCRILASSLYVLLQLGRMGIVVLLPSIALTLVTGIPVHICIIVIGAISIFFTVKGGIEAVIWVEVIQVLILAIGALFCLFYLPFHIQHWEQGTMALQNQEKLKTLDFRFDFTQPTFWVVLIGGMAINLLTYGSDQTTVQRYLTTKSEKESIKSLQLGAWLTLPSTLVFFSIGTLLYLFYREQPQLVNMALDSQDNIFPWYIVSQLPAGLSGLLIAGIFAAAMSSTEASMNSTATLLTTDFYQKLKPQATPAQSLLFARITTFALGLFVTVIALYMAYKGVSSLWDKFNTILGLFTGCIGGAFLLGIFTTRANGHGVMLGMVISCITQLFIQQYSTMHFLLYAFTGLMSCMVSGYLLSLIWPPKSDLKGLTRYT
ncbi:sodium:solute symporter family transporter [Dyadobacter tibetensis]|uniref:sodium:solute symporter family transporter n=1 Tax=Dyadobacter tibetensis TaxID=1211851 RepID=UPI00046F68DA|nr:sodium/solute symporter [Dyadobacter tibetensis]